MTTKDIDIVLNDSDRFVFIVKLVNGDEYEARGDSFCNYIEYGPECDLISIEAGIGENSLLVYFNAKDVISITAINSPEDE